jgi:hypothetical protein
VVIVGLPIVQTIAAMIVAATVVPVVTVRILAVAEVVSGVAEVVVAAVDATSAKVAGAICLPPNTLRRRAVNAEAIAVRIVAPIVVMTGVLIAAVTAEAIVAMIAVVAAIPIAADLKIVARVVTLTAIAARIPRVLPIPAKKLSCFPANP